MDEEDYLQISGIQHFAFCRRQWALIHVEGQWAENVRTVEGGIVHERAHDPDMDESRGDTLILRGLRVVSHRLRLSGECDVVEFHQSDNGAALKGRQGLWLPLPVEYKRGTPKTDGSDEMQLACQALCLEEMFACDVPRGAIYYNEPRRRTAVEITKELRDRTESAIREMNDYMARGHTPKGKMRKGCSACSLADICLPRLEKSPDTAEYIRRHVEETVV